MDAIEVYGAQAKGYRYYNKGKDAVLRAVLISINHAEKTITLCRSTKLCNEVGNSSWGKRLLVTLRGNPKIESISGDVAHDITWRYLIYPSCDIHTCV